ncbi:acyl-CoA dehydrogenase family protein [Rhodococcus rhodochrous]|uniref:acyl-CoA dehydrogenase family protein n=1 Tax=Rhodococcus rhodochrous TaxID=1829 RepID=UPI001E646ED0|nr:acyl-CoA dehydrogenase family protein [Rhodococcus rhodochrous]
MFVRAETTAGPAIFVVDTSDTGVVREIQDSMDLTRSFSRLRFESASARLLDSSGAADDVLESLRDLVAVALACEQYGGAEAALNAAVEYVSQRVQFGREIGSFQAVKHRCADLAIALDDARSAVSYATWALHESHEALRLAAPMAALVCGRTFVECAKENVHLHGGVGFTWEHSAHLYFRRAMTDATLFSVVERHYEQILAAQGVHALG